MEVLIKMDNLQSIIEEAAKENTEAAIKGYVSQKTQQIIDAKYGKIIEEQVTEKLEQSIADYIDTYRVSVGGGLDGSSIQYLTPREYINKIITDTFRDHKFTTYIERSYGGTEKVEVTFEKFIKESLDPTNEIKRHMTKLSKSIKDDINMLLKREYDSALQHAISGVVFDVIMQNEEFKNINKNIKRLSDD